MTESLDIYRALFKNMNLGVVFHAPGGHITSANPAAEEILGLTLDQMQGRTSIDSPWRVLQEDGSDFPEEQHPARVALEMGKEVRDVIMGIFNPVKEEYRWININAVPLFPSGERNPYQVYTLFEDITEKKRMETRLKEKTKLLERERDACQDIFEAVPVALLLVNESMEVVSVNSLAARMVRKSSLEMLNRPPGDGLCCIQALSNPRGCGYASACDKCSIRTTLKKVLQTGKPVREKELEHYLVIDGEEKRFWFSINSSSLFIEEKWHALLAVTDITQRKKTEEEVMNSNRELEKTTQKLDNFLKATRTGFDIIDGDFNLHYVDPLWANVYGEPGNGKCYQYFKDRDTPCENCGIPRALERKEIVVSEQVLPKEDNRVVEVHTIPFQEEEGRWLVAEFKVDITRRKHMEEELRKSREQFMLAVKGSQEGIWDWDLRNNSLYLSPKWKEMMGYEDGELTNSFETFEELLHPEDKPEVMDYVERYLKGEFSTYSIEFRFRHKDGSYRWIVARGEALRNEEGIPYRMAGSHRDITERKEVEETLKSFRIALDSSPDSIFIINRESMQFVDANETACKELGYSLDELLSMGPQDIKPWYSREKLAAEFDRIIAGESSTGIIQTSHRCKDGSMIPVEVFLKAFQSKGDSMLIASVRDITERLIIESEIREAKEKAEAANRAKSEFLANMSHEIRTPMNVIIGMSELLHDTELKAEQQEYAGMIKDSANSLLTIINDILDFSKIEAGRLELERSSFNIISLVEKTVSPLAIRAHARGLELLFYIKENVPRVLVGDPNRLRQVLINLLGNAIKFTEKGEVLLTVEKDEGPYLRFLVRDTGPGIPEDKHGLLFQSFSQVDSSSTRKHGGTGLGLAISKKLVELMGGTIGLISTSEDGSTFSFTIPLEEPEETDGLEERETAPTLSEIEGLNVLVIDDNRANRMIMKEMLNRWGLRVETASGGKEGLEMLRAAVRQGSSFDLVLLDQQMPILDGFQVAEKVRGEKNLQSLLMMMVSSVDMQQSADRCRETGLDGYMVKPVKQSDLLNKIYQILNQKKQQVTNKCLETNVVTDINADADFKSRENSTLQILLVEDKPMNRKLATVLLEKKGWSVTSAHNGREALDLLASNTFDLVLMDVQMPEMDGLEATRQIRALEEKTGGHIPIIAMTAHAMKRDREKCLEAGMDGYVSKPINSDELYLAVEEAAYPEQAHSRSRPEKPSSSATAQEDMIQEAASMLKALGGNKKLLGEMVELLQEEASRDLVQLQKLLAKQDSSNAALVAHGLKGQLGNLGMEKAFTMVKDMEMSLQAKNLKEASFYLEKLQEELKKLEIFFEQKGWQEML